MLIQKPKFKAVVAIEGDEKHKMILVKEKNEELDKFAKENNLDIEERNVSLTYENFSLSKQQFNKFAAEVLRELLPQDVGEIPSGYEAIGDIAHMNLN